MAEPQKKMTLMGLTTLVAVNMMGSGIIMLPTNLAQLGAVSLLSWIVTAIGSMAIAYCFAQLGVLCPRSGGMSAYSEEAHGKSSFFMASFLYYLSLAIGNVAIAISAVGYLTPFFPWLGSGAIPLFVGVVTLIWLTTFANFGGAAVTGRIGALTVWGVIIPVAGLSIFGWFWFKPEVFAAAWNPHGIAANEAIVQSIPLTLWAFLGMESAAQNAGAVENPQKTVPMACMLGTLGAAAIYILSTSVIQGIVPNAELAQSSAPFAQVYAQMFSPGIGRIVMALAVMACLGSLLGWQFTLSQTSKFTADERMFPAFYAKVNKSGAPVIGMLVAGGLQTLMAISTISPNASEQFGKLVSLAAVTNIVPYITAITALLVVMFTSRVEGAVYNRNVAAILVAVIYSCYALYASGKDAVFGGMIVMMVGYMLYGFIAYRFTARAQVTVPTPSPSMRTAHAALWLVAAVGIMAPGDGHSQTLERIQRSQVINLGFAADRPPFSSVSDAGNPRGYAIDMCLQVVEELKQRVPDLQVYFVPMYGPADFSLIEQDKVDLSCSAIPETLRAREQVSFSVPIYFTGIGALVRKDAPPALIRVLSGQISHTGPTWRATVNAGLANHNYAIHSGTVQASWVRERVARLGVIVKLTVVDSYAAGLQAVEERRVDAFFADRAGLDSAVARQSGEQDLLVLERRFSVEPMALAMKRSDEDFRLFVDAALAGLYRSGNYLNTYVTYFGEPSETARMLFEGYGLR
jgi:putrescine:ornithine antiporter